MEVICFCVQMRSVLNLKRVIGKGDRVYKAAAERIPDILFIFGNHEHRLQKMSIVLSTKAATHFDTGTIDFQQICKISSTSNVFS